MGDFISEEFRTSRTDTKQCYLCGHMIHKGEKYRRSFFKDDGITDSIYSINEHKECYDMISDLEAACLLDSGEYTDDDFVQAIHEVCREEICPNCPCFDKECEECKDDKNILHDCFGNIREFMKTHTYKYGKGWIKWEV